MSKKDEFDWLSEDFTVFGMGEAGIPQHVRLVIEVLGGEHVARLLVKACQDARKMPVPPDWVRTWALLLVEWYVKEEGSALPGPVLHAVAHALGQVNLDTHRAVPAAQVRARVGLPSDVRRSAMFLAAAARQGMALTYRVVLQGHRTDVAEEVTKRIRARRWALNEADVCQGKRKEDGRSESVQIKTVKKWHRKPEFAAIARRFAELQIESALADDDAALETMLRTCVDASIDEILHIAGETELVDVEYLDGTVEDLIAEA